MPSTPNSQCVFATRGVDKFADAGFVADEPGLPHLDQACVTLRCTLHAQTSGGDHSILIGRVENIRIDASTRPTVYFRRAFCELVN